MCNVMSTNKLDNIAIIGLGLLGGSVGLAVNRALSGVKRFGYSHRSVTRIKALQAGAIDVDCGTLAEAVSNARLVILASPLGTFADIMREMADYLPDGCVVTDVGSTKVKPVQWARKYLPDRVVFVGSHPMAGSEQRGVEFARADLFDDANCILTPAGTSARVKLATKLLREFWQTLGMLVSTMTPAQHDRILSRISHLPHVLAMSLVNMCNENEMLLCGKGFLDTTRIASGPPGLWRDILGCNAGNITAAIDRYIAELERVKKTLNTDTDSGMERLCKLLERAQGKRNELIKNKLKRKELPI